MTSRAWEALVDEGVRLGQADPLDRWAIGDLSLEAVPPGTDRSTRSQAQRLLEEFSRATALKLSLLKDCHRTSRAWPPEIRISGISQARHSKLAARPNRIDLLLNDELDDGLSDRVRERVHKVEDLLADKEVRQACLDRPKQRSTAVARALQNEELVKARAALRVLDQDARAAALAPEIEARRAERAIKGNQVLARMVVDLLELHGVVDQLPPSYHDRTTENLQQIARAAQRVLDELRPDHRSPQPGHIIDID